MISTNITKKNTINDLSYNYNLHMIYDFGIWIKLIKKRQAKRSIYI